MVPKFEAEGFLISKSIREMENGLKYAVLGVSTKINCQSAFFRMMCFNENIYNKLEVEIEYHFKGHIAFSSGNTFLNVKRAKMVDADQFEVVYDE